MAQVIFADGTFIDGSTSELSCDGPLREPFAVFCQVRFYFSCILMNAFFFFFFLFFRKKVYKWRHISESL